MWLYEKEEQKSSPRAALQYNVCLRESPSESCIYFSKTNGEEKKPTLCYRSTNRLQTSCYCPQCHYSLIFSALTLFHLMIQNSTYILSDSP